jgi:Bifunctional DNA primase/polymerase, N-terminal
MLSTTTSRSERQRTAGAMLAAAIELAGEGHPVLPLDGKIPRGGYGLSWATTDEDAIAGWWRRWPEANVGLRCDGLLVVDVDGPVGELALVELELRLGPLPATRSQTTGKGRHLLYSTLTELGNSTVALGRPAGIDMRSGRRGYIVAAPSVHPSGRRYAWVDPEQPLAGLPAVWLRALHRPKTRPAVAPILNGRSSAYGRAAMQSELELLLRAREGERNETLNLAVFRLAQLAAGGELDRSELEAEATCVGTVAGLPAAEVRKTIRSALEAGLRHPRRRRGRGDYRGEGAFHGIPS